jgi:Trk K+ transport system NAD-binding subunit
MAAYRVALRGNVRQVRGLRAGGVIIEAEVPSDSYLSGRLVAEVPWPRDAVLVAIERRDGLVVPRGDLRLAEGDRISIFAAPTASMEVEALLSLASEPSHVEVDQDARWARARDLDASSRSR